MNGTEENSESTQSGKTKKNLHKEFILESKTKERIPIRQLL